MDKEDVVNVHNELLLSHKKHEITPFAATWMYLEMIRLSEGKSDRKDEYLMISLLCGI